MQVNRHYHFNVLYTSGYERINMKQKLYSALIVCFLVISCVALLDIGYDEDDDADDKADKTTDYSLFDQPPNSSGSRSSREDYRPLMITIGFVFIMLIVAACLKILIGPRR